jgi:transcriptional regulator of acetoin/glycerol metabolism
LVCLGVDNRGEEPSNYHIHIEDQAEKWRGSWVDDAMKALLAYDWPGNVRELENCLERASAFTSGSVIQVSDLPSAIHGAPVYPSNGGNGKTQIMPMAELEKQTILSTIAQLNGDKLLAARMLGIGKTTLYRKLKEYVTQRAKVAGSCSREKQVPPLRSLRCGPVGMTDIRGLELNPPYCGSPTRRSKSM